MTDPTCLVIDDEPDILELLVMTLTPMGIDCHTAASIQEAQQQLHSHAFNLCLTDMHLPDGNGIDLVSYIQQHYPNTPVAVITAHGNVESAVQALKAGAFDFISKPVDLKPLRDLVTVALRLSAEQDNVLAHLVGAAPAMQQLKNKIQKLARSQAPIYIKGESGVGKEVVARLIHQLGARADKPFVPVNCGAIPSELMESEFFGHKKGSFTGAHTDKPGLFQTAQAGTLFLDEVADLPLSMQVKLLRAIQEKQVRPIGAAREVPVDVRILSATHRDLAILVKENKFRQDLFYRINVIELFVPPLRERCEDIPTLVDSILTRLHQANTLTNALEVERPYLSPKALAALQQYPFPGNVRELENILERAMTLCENNRILPEDLQLPEIDAPSDMANGFVPHPPNLVNVEKGKLPQLDPLLDDLEKEAILNALEQTNGNKTRAAELLGISFGAFRYRLQKLKIK